MCVSRAGQGPRIAESRRNKSARSAGSTCHFFTTGGRRGRRPHWSLCSVSGDSALRGRGTGPGPTARTEPFRPSRPGAPQTLKLRERSERGEEGDGGGGGVRV